MKTTKVTSLSKHHKEKCIKRKLIFQIMFIDDCRVKLVGIFMEIIR